MLGGVCSDLDLKGSQQRDAESVFLRKLPGSSTGTVILLPTCKTLALNPKNPIPSKPSTLQALKPVSCQALQELSATRAWVLARRPPGKELSRVARHLV